MPQYPASLNEVLDPAMLFNPDVLRAVKAFARSKPWQGTMEERKEKFRTLNTGLATAFGVESPEVFFLHVEQDRPTGAGAYNPERRAIVLAYKLSVLTYLELFASLFGWSDRRVLRWSINLFKRVFPRSFAGLRYDPRSGRMVKDGQAPEPRRGHSPLIEGILEDHGLPPTHGLDGMN